MKQDTLTVVVDSREKNPLLFSNSFEWTDQRMKSRIVQVKTEVETVDAGDYYLRGYEDVVRIERKGSIAEVQQNLFGGDRGRAMRAFKKFQDSCEYPYLLIDESVVGMNRKSRYCKRPKMVQDFLYRELAVRRIGLLWLPQLTSVSGKKIVTDSLLRIMWAHCCTASAA